MHLKKMHCILSFFLGNVSQKFNILGVVLNFEAFLIKGHNYFDRLKKCDFCEFKKKVSHRMF